MLHIIYYNRQMTRTQYYRVAGHVIALTADDDYISMLNNCQPFITEASEPLLTIEIEGSKPLPDGWEEDCRQEEESNEIVCGHIGERPMFIFQSVGRITGWLSCSPDYRNATLAVASKTKYVIDNAMMICFALATASLDTLLFHSSVVCRNGKAYMFLGPSGTGKSTHTQLWLRHIEGSHLLNDDNPVVRIMHDGTIMVYGSPWSGKTPCYRNEQYPLGAIVRLYQAPHNAITRLAPINAYVALSSSISGKRWDRSIADGLHNTLNRITANTGIWRMDCLPDEAAAVMTSTTI